MKDNLEDFFKHTLEDFKDAPADKVWEALEQRLEPPHQHTFNNKLLLPFLITCLMVVSTFSLVGYISLRQKTEKLSAQILEKQHKIKVLQKDKTRYRITYAKLENDCKPNIRSPFSQASPFRDDDIVPMMEL